MLSINLRVLMAEHGVKATEVSVETGIPLHTLRRMCTANNKSVKFEHLYALCQYFGCTERDLLSKEPPIPTKRLSSNM